MPPLRQGGKHVTAQSREPNMKKWKKTKTYNWSP